MNIVIHYFTQICQSRWLEIQSRETLNEPTLNRNSIAVYQGLCHSWLLALSAQPQRRSCGSLWWTSTAGDPISNDYCVSLLKVLVLTGRRGPVTDLPTSVPMASSQLGLGGGSFFFFFNCETCVRLNFTV